MSFESKTKLPCLGTLSRLHVNVWLSCLIFANSPGPSNSISFAEGSGTEGYQSNSISAPFRGREDDIMKSDNGPWTTSSFAPVDKYYNSGPVFDQDISTVTPPRGPSSELRRSLTEATVSPSIEPTCSWVCAEEPTVAPIADCPCLNEAMFPKWHILATESVTQFSASVSGSVSACGSTNTTSSFEHYAVGVGFSGVETSLTTLRILGKLDVSSTSVYQGQTLYGTLSLGDDVIFQGGTAIAATLSDFADCSTDIATVHDTAEFLFRNSIPTVDDMGCSVRALNATAKNIVFNAFDVPAGRGGYSSFCVAASDLTSASRIEFQIEPSSLIVIVVTDYDVTEMIISKLVFASDVSLAVLAARIIWVFPKTINVRLNIKSTNWIGTIIAPEADVNIDHSVVNGKAYVKSIVGLTPHRISNDALVLPNCTCNF